MSWFQSFIRRHVIADDTAPGYSRLDHYGGLGEAPARARTAFDQPGTIQPAATNAEPHNRALTAIQARLEAESGRLAEELVDQSVHDRRYLLKLAREQQSRLDKVARIADRLDLSPHPEDRTIAELLREAIRATGTT